MEERIKNFKSFYPYYLEEHRKEGTRIGHFIGTSLVFLTLFFCISTKKYVYLWLMPVFGYGFAWYSHAFIERNKPATFKYPLWSLFSDFKLFFEILFRKRRFNDNNLQ